MTTRRAALLCSTILLTALAACSRQGAPATFTQQVGLWSAVLTVEPYPPVPMQAAMLELAVTDQTGHSISGAAVTFDLSMPGMQMPVNRPEATEPKDGNYRAEAMFTMAGQWRLVASVSSGNHVETFAFDLHTR